MGWSGWFGPTHPSPVRPGALWTPRTGDWRTSCEKSEIPRFSFFWELFCAPHFFSNLPGPKEKDYLGKAAWFAFHKLGYSFLPICTCLFSVVHVLVSARAAGIGRASGSSWLSSKSLFEKLICYEINNAGQFC